MKKLWKMALLTILGTCIALCLGISAAAETHSGEVDSLGDLFTWTVDTDTRTLTIEGSGGTFAEKFVPWEDWEDSVDTVVLLGKGKLQLSSEHPLGQSFLRMEPDIVYRQDNGSSWEYIWKEHTVNYYGQGILGPFGWGATMLSDLTEIDTLKFSDEVVWVSPLPYIEFYTLILGTNADILEASATDLYTLHRVQNIIVDESNPKYCSYDGAVYSKDGSSLYCATRLDVDFHPNLRYLERYSLEMSDGTVVLPWGLQTINGGALRQLVNVTVILPDTLTFINGDNNNPEEVSRLEYYITVRFSKNNKEAIAKLTGGANTYGKLTPEIVDSVAEYYPDIPEAQGQSSTPASEPSQPPVSQPQSSQNTSAVSQPESSRPSSNSSTSSQISTAPSSQSSTSSVTSSQPVSKPASEPTLSSQPEESSIPEESSAVSEEPSSEASVSEPESSLPEESELSEPSAPADRAGGFSSLWPLFLVLGAAVICAGVVIFLIWRKK